METQLTEQVDADKLEGQWLVAGSSPSAADWLPRVQKPGMRSITTNRGISLFDGESPPDVYFLGGELLTEGDEFAEQRAAGRRVKEQGTRVIGLSRDAAINEAWDIAWLDEFLIIELGCWRPWKFIPGKYTACRLSGLFCLQYALNHGAKGVHVVGMEGYADRGHYFDGSDDSQKAIDERTTAETIQPFTQAVVSACPEVMFTFYGDLLYPVVGSNVTLIKDASECDSNSNDAGADSDPAT